MPARLPLAAAALLLLAACNDDTEDTGGRIVTREHPQELPEWLTPHDKIDPAVWLRSREVGHTVAYEDAEVGRLRRAIAQAVQRFFEDPRMIANRTEQTEKMLAQAGTPERSVDIMTGLIDVADVSSAKKLYGEMCQHYLNVRKSGQDRGKAIAELMAAYRHHATLGAHDKVP